MMLLLFLIRMFQTLNQLIQNHGDSAQNNDRSDQHIELKYLGTVNNQIPEAASGRQKFSNDNAHKAQSDIDFHIA